tara:strand:- start:111 stop:305 length:195 start_codon:yes stop_codon:yes gene_type:complete
MVTRAKQINSSYANKKAKSPRSVINQRINDKVAAKKKPKPKPKVVKPKSTASIKKRANKMFDSF